MTHHDLDIHPIPEDKTPLFINEPWMIDKSLQRMLELNELNKEPQDATDNIRIYLPMDLNKDAILRRLNHVIDSYNEANEENELDFSMDVEQIISQIEIYDQVWFVREGEFPIDKNGMITGHSRHAMDLVKAFIEKLESIPDGCTETFPFETIDELKSEYLMD